MKNKPKYSEIEMIISDWKDMDGAFNQFAKSLKKMGLYIYTAPSCEGSDDYSLIISKTKFKSNKEAEAAAMGFTKEEYKRYLNGEEP